MKKFEISLFKFNPKMDYLPYYKKIVVKSSLDSNLLELLKQVNDSLDISFEDSLDFGVVVNGKYLSVSQSLDSIYSEFGSDLQIEPISIKRAIDDLIIDDSDFYQKLESFKQYIDDEDRANYDKYKLNYYASNSIKYNEDYVGDAFLYIADDIICKNSENELEILKLLANDILYHTDSSSRLFSKESVSINLLIKRLESNNLLDTTPTNFQNYIDFSEFGDLDGLKHNFEKFNIAYFGESSKTKSELEKLNSNMIKLNSNGSDLSTKTLKIDKNFTYKISADILLEAFDKGADFLVVDTKESFYLFDKLQKDIEKVAQRDINLPIIYISELESLAKGEIESIKESLQSHSVKVDLV